jgi:D-alanyl-lipoteichoic acid acyltransferase DltB (MBOAT superfamily)
VLFDSSAYFFFLIPVVLIYWRLGHRSQNIFVLGASYLFYGWWDWRFLALMIGSTTMDFLVAQKIAPGHADRKKWLIVSLVANLAILGIFKYFNFFVDSFHGALEALGVHQIPLPLIRVILPPGISFYTFQEIAYIVDVYKGRIRAVESFTDYALFISLFPHLIAGPIQRPTHLLPQVQTPRVFDAERFFDGMMLILSGLIRKCVVADNCAVIANAAFNGDLGTTTFWVVLLGTFAFAWQVYGDFSGYSDMARGSAQLLGFQFMLNFRQPYLARRFQDFWRRWHISLSTWLRDYVYIPLGGSSGPPSKTARNLLLTMLLAGLWHGANWTFVVFGAIHGVALAIERLVFSPTPSTGSTVVLRDDGWLSEWAQRVVVFNLFCLTLVFFRAQSLAEAIHFLGGLSNLAWRNEYAPALFMLALFSLPLFVVDLALERTHEEYPFARIPYAYRTGLAATAILVLAFFSGADGNAFIYFQF